jgi:hypothetical protein
MRNYTPATTKATPKSFRSNQTQIDPYLAKTQPKEFSICEQCYAVYHNKHWTLENPFVDEKTKGMKRGIYTLCPACQKIQDHFPLGFLSLSGSFIKNHKDEILHRIKNEEKMARGLNPLARIIEIHEGNGKMEISTTNEKLAQRIGKSLHKAFKGNLVYKWSNNNKFMRVEWMRD